MSSAIAAIVCGALATLAIEDPQLDAVRDEVSDDDDDDDGSDGDAGLGDAVAGALELIDAIESSRPMPAFASHPYAAGRRLGITTPTESEETPGQARAGSARKVSARIALDGSWQYHGLWRGRLAFEIDSTARIGGGLQLYAWGNPGTPNHMLLASARLHGTIGNWKHGILRTGPAIDVMRSWTPHEWLVAVGADWGFSADVFPIRPLVLSFDAQWGILGRSLYLGGRATIGVVLRRVELFGGYEHKQIGRVGVGGPVLGMRVWF